MSEDGSDELGSSEEEVDEGVAEDGGEGGEEETPAVRTASRGTEGTAKSQKSEERSEGTAQSEDVEEQSQGVAKSEEDEEQEGQEEEEEGSQHEDQDEQEENEDEQEDDEQSAASPEGSEYSQTERSQGSEGADEEEKPGPPSAEAKAVAKRDGAKAAPVKKEAATAVAKKMSAAKKKGKKLGKGEDDDSDVDESDPLLGGKKSDGEGMNVAQIQSVAIKVAACLLCLGSIGGVVAIIWASRSFWEKLFGRAEKMESAAMKQLRNIPCIFYDWSDWTACSATCGAGKIRSHRRFGPSNCKPKPTIHDLKREVPCEVAACPGQACSTHSWEDWSPCSQPCGLGVQTRIRAVAMRPTAGGKPCPALVQKAQCHVKDCPKHCIFWPWSPWSLCSRTCGRGQIERERSVFVDKPGFACAHRRETSPCDLGPCGAPCTFEIPPRIMYAQDLSLCKGTASGDSCHFDCEHGYQPEGPLRCLDGIFVLKPCIPLACMQEPRITNSRGLEVCRGYAVGSVCRVICIHGFQKSGDITCQAKKVGGAGWFGRGKKTELVDWTSAACTPITCQKPPSIENSYGADSCEGLALGETCSTFGCNEGYEKTDDLRCVHGNFNRPRCIEKPCRYVPPLVHDEVRYARHDECIRTASAGLPVPSRITCPLTCRDEYRKTRDTICVRGRWLDGHCEAKTSPCWKEEAGCNPSCVDTVLPDIRNAAPYECKDLSDGAECEVECEGGYVTTGNLMCTNGTWLSARCEPVGCHSSPSVLHAHDLHPCADSRHGDACILICNPGYYPSKPALSCSQEQWIGAECLEDLCSAPPRVANGFTEAGECRGLRPGEFCPLSCAAGYEPSPSAGLECLTGGNYAMATCEPRKCHDAPQVSHSGDLSICMSAVSGSSCALSCMPGYFMAGSHVLCDRGKWTFAACHSSDRCGDLPPQLPHADSDSLMQCVDTTIGEPCKDFICLPGYSPHGLLFCKRGGHFSRPSCKGESCMYVPSVKSATDDPSCNNVESGDVCSVHCPFGYTKTGDLLCWNGAYANQASCVFMSDSVQRERETISLQLSVLHSYKGMELKERGVLIGPRVVHALAVAAGIATLRIIERGMSPVGNMSMITFDILPGGPSDRLSAMEALHRIEETLEEARSVLEKLLGGYAWHLSHIQLVGSSPGKICREEPQIEYATELPECIDTLSGKMCPLVCMAGYRSDGDLMCSDGTWSAARCEAVPCENLPEIENAADLTHCLGTPSYSSCRPDCEPGYEASGDLECRHGEFVLPTCSPKPCMNSFVEPNTNIDVDTHCRGMTSGEDCVLRCAAAMFPSGLGVFRCDRGNWRHLGICKPADCFHVPSIHHTATVLEGCFGTRHGSYCPVACKEGYTITERLWCLHGEFAPTQCEPSQCLEVPEVAGIEQMQLLKCAPADTGSFCDVQCGLGFMLNHPLFCDHGAWSNPTCVGVGEEVHSCKHPPEIAQALNLSHCVGISSGEVCHVVCHEGYEFHGMARCTDGKWTQHAFCVPHRCMNAPVRDRSTDLERCAGYSHGSKCVLWCEPGYSAAGLQSIIPDRMTMHELKQLVDASSLTCDKGEWVGPRCMEAPCDSEPTGIPSEMRVGKCAGTPSGKFCQIECVHGFYATSHPLCIRGVWNGSSEVYCREAPCNHIPVVAHGYNLAKCANMSSGEACTLECERGKPLPQHILCVRGAWAKAACLESCDYLPSIGDAGDLAHCAGTLAGSSCSFSCRPGFRPSSPLLCLNGGQFDSAFCYESATSLSEVVVTDFNVTGLHADSIQEIHFAAVNFRDSFAHLLRLRPDLVSIQIKPTSSPVAQHLVGLWILCRSCVHIVQRSYTVSHSTLERVLRDDLCDETCVKRQKGIIARSCRASCHLRHPLHITGQSTARVINLNAAGAEARASRGRSLSAITDDTPEDRVELF